MLPTGPTLRRATILLAIVAGVLAIYLGTRHAPSSWQPYTARYPGTSNGGLSPTPTGKTATPVRGALFIAGKEVSGDDRPVWPRRYGVRSKMEDFSRAMVVTLASAASFTVLSEGDAVVFPYFDGRVMEGHITHVRRLNDGQRLLMGRLVSGGTFTLGEGPRGFGGRIMPEGEKNAGVFQSTKTRRAFLLEKPRQSVICEYYPKRELSADDASTSPAEDDYTITIPQPAFSSRPEETAVVYLDFDGEVVAPGEWSYDEIHASHSWLYDEQIKIIWQRVSEDFRPFKINVTTDVSVYTAAPIGRRMRCIVTSTTLMGPDSGGVAYLGSWADAGAPGYSDDVPCWVFPWNLSYDPKAIAEAISHEIGHTLGLSHDGLEDEFGMPVEEYYLGHGAGETGWAPIMGAGYYQPLTQWSRGEYAALVTTEDGIISAVANNTEDDLAIISSHGNRTGYVDDGVAGALHEASNLPLPGPGYADFTGELARTGEVDAFQFSAGAGVAHFTIGVASEDAGIDGIGNIDAQLELYDFSGSLLGTFNPPGAITAEFSMLVPAGIYRLRIRGTGEGDIAGVGYSNYGSVGRYRVNGTFSDPGPHSPVIGGPLEWTAVKGTASAYQVQALGTPVAFHASGLPSSLRMNTATGLITGTPLTEGEYAVTLTVVNQQGRSSRELLVFVLSGDPADVTGSPDLTWTQGGDLPWKLDKHGSADHGPALQSGAVMGDQNSWVETTVTGPGELHFQWKVSSEENTWRPGDPWDPAMTPDPAAPFDRLEFSIDGDRQAFISGEVDWTERTYSVPPGLHTLRWTYQKDPYTSLGEDAGWLARVSYVRAESPEIMRPEAAVVTEGSGYTYRIVATNGPSRYSVTGLPAGLTLNESTGIIRGAPEQAGVYVMVLGAENAQGSTSADFTLTVQTRFAGWAETFGVANTPSLAQDDADGDGWPNLLEYAFGSSPVNADAHVGPVVEVYGEDGSSRLEVEFIKPMDRAELTYTVEVSSDLAVWSSGHSYGPRADNSGVSATEEVQRTIQADGSERIRVRDVSMAMADSKRFIRVKVTLP